MISSTDEESAFTETDFQNGKEALANGKELNKHESSECHKEAPARMVQDTPDCKRGYWWGDAHQICSRKIAQS